MTAHLVDEVQFIQEFLKRIAAGAGSRTHAVWRLLQSVAEILEHAGISILSAKQEFSRECEGISKENDCLRELLEHCYESLGVFARTLKEMGRDVKLHLCDPLQTFYYDLQISHKKSVQTCLDLSDSIEDNLRRLKQLERSFEEKRQMLCKKRTYLLAEQSKYRGDIISINDLWPEIQYRCGKLLQEFDAVNESRCEFTKKQVAEFERVINRMQQLPQIEQRLRQLEKKPYEQHYVENALVSEVEQRFGRSQLLRPLKIFTAMMVQLQQQGEDKEKQQQIDEFSETYLVNSVKETSLEKRALVLEDPKFSEYFLCCICSRLHTQKPLPSNKYNDLLTLIKYIFAESMQHADNQAVLYSILYLSLRIINQGLPMIKELNKYREYWENEARWEAILKHIHGYMQRDHASRRVTSHLRKADTIFQRLLEKQQVEIQTHKYQALREVNVLLTQLELNSNFTVQLIAKEAKRFGLTRDQTESLLMYQEQTRKNSLDHLYFNKKAQLTMREDRMLKNLKAGWLFAIKRCLPFLSIDQPHELMALKLVCRKWNDYLWLPIFKRYLIIEPNLNKLEKMRPRLYQALIPQAYNEKLYHRMLEEIPEDFALRDQIEMDVKRSLNDRQELRGCLYNMLLAFSFYNDKIGYVQGMNYIGENILKLTLPPQSAYCMLEYMLRRYFSTLFAGNLDNLRLKVYQLTRLMARVLPSLAKHFDNEKIESQHFMVSWIVTLWGQMEGDIVWLLWDGFLAEGWKWWVKVSLWVLGIFENDLLEMPFEDILRFFSDVSNHTFFKCRFNEFLVFAVSPLKIREEIRAIPVTNRMLELLESEYANSQKKYQDILKAA